MPELSAAWMLHCRPYKERSVIAEFLVEDYGRIAMVVRGVRQAKSRTAPLLQPFNKVQVSWRGRGELKSLVTLEPVMMHRLSGQNLYCGLYVNELILRALIPGQWLEGLAELYELVIEKLSGSHPVEPVLRLFELELLELTGYAPSLHYTVSGDPVVAGAIYQLIPENGLMPVSSPVKASQDRCYQGEMLLALGNRDFSVPEYYPGFKRFTRQALAPLTGNKPLRSRALFSKLAVQ